MGRLPAVGARPKNAVSAPVLDNFACAGVPRARACGDRPGVHIPQPSIFSPSAAMLLHAAAAAAPAGAYPPHDALPPPGPPGPRFRPYASATHHVTKGRYITSNDVRGYM